jgi:hypothetical protein
MFASLKKRYSGNTECYGTLIVEPPDVQSSRPMDLPALQKRYSNTEMYGSIIIEANSIPLDPSSSHPSEMVGTLLLPGPVESLEDSMNATQNLQRRFTNTEMYGTMLVDAPVMAPSSRSPPGRKRWYDPMDEVRSCAHLFAVTHSRIFSCNNKLSLY